MWLTATEIFLATTTIFLELVLLTARISSFLSQKLRYLTVRSNLELIYLWQTLIKLGLMFILIFPNACAAGQ